jgi:lipopolysaccharide transport system permease protein
MKKIGCFFTDPFIFCSKYIKLLHSSTIMEIHHTHAGSLLGSVWLVANPLILLGLYTFIYAVVFGFCPPGMSLSEYVLYIFCGLIPFLGFNNGLMAGVSSLTVNKQILLNTVFPSELLAVRSVLAGSTVMIIGFIIILCAALFIHSLHLTVFWVPLVIILQLMFLIGLSWILSLANLVVRDIQQFLSYAMTLLMIISPIAYTPDMIPAKLRLIIYLNPLAYYVIVFRDLIMNGYISSAKIVVVCVLQSLIAFSVGFFVFQRMKRVFFDYA